MRVGIEAEDEACGGKFDFHISISRKTRMGDLGIFEEERRFSGLLFVDVVIVFGCRRVLFFIIFVVIVIIFDGVVASEEHVDELIEREAERDWADVLTWHDMKREERSSA